MKRKTSLFLGGTVGPGITLTGMNVSFLSSKFDYFIFKFTTFFD